MTSVLYPQSSQQLGCISLRSRALGRPAPEPACALVGGGKLLVPVLVLIRQGPPHAAKNLGLLGDGHVWVCLAHFSALFRAEDEEGRLLLGNRVRSGGRLLADGLVFLVVGVGCGGRWHRRFRRRGRLWLRGFCLLSALRADRLPALRLLFLFCDGARCFIFSFVGLRS